MTRDNRNHKSRKGKVISRKKVKRDVILLIDLEAACWRGHPPVGMYNEIIEIGISGVDYKTKEIKFKDTILVKPKYSEISKFCTELTSITQEMIDDKGVSFQEACVLLEEKFFSKERVWMSWGEFDKNQLIKDCELNSVEFPFKKSYFDLCPLFSFTFGLQGEMGVKQALEYLGLDFEGTQHRGEDDAYNIARILQKMYPKLEKEADSHVLKKEHELIIEHLENTYGPNLVEANIARVLNKTLPQ